MLILMGLLPLIVLWLSRQLMASFFLANCQFSCTGSIGYLCFARQ
uniref:Uncharacterized protein n=1 Tax=Triticum urartu TaxID=4572 RepID=A0A8R7V4Q0_TRIUA